MIKIKKYQIEDYISDATQDALDLKADLVNGKVPASQLPSFVDDVIEVANYAALPIPGATGVIYITLDTNKVYRWTGSVYVEIASGVTNLSYTPGVSNGTVNSDTGSDATIPLAGTVNAGLFLAAEKSKLEGIAPNANVGVIPNTPITGATKTKITYDTKGLVTAGADATTADIADSTNKRYVTDANLTVINNTSGTNTGDQDLQQVTDLGASTTNPIIVTVVNDDAITGNSQSGVAVQGSSPEGNGIFGNSINGDGAGGYSETGNAGAFYGIDKGIKVTAGNTFVAELNQGLTSKGLVINSGASSTGNFIELDKNGVDKLIVNQAGELTAAKLIKDGGTSAQLLAANGDTITAGTNITISGGTISSVGGAGGSSSVNFYLNGSIASNVSGYQQIGSTAVIGGGTDFTLAGNGTIAQFLTDVGSPNRLEIPSGAWNFELWLQSSINNSGTNVHIELYKYNGAFTLIATGVLNPINLQTNATTNLYVTNVAIPQTTLLATDRLAIRVIASNAVGLHSVTLHTEDSNICEVITNFVGGVTAINGITQPSQTLATGTTGTDFAVVSSGSTHTFNLPNASLTARGVVTTGTQSFNGLKTFNNGINVGLSGVLGDSDITEPYNAWTTNGSFYDLNTKANDNDVVHLAGSETMTGIKTIAPVTQDEEDTGIVRNILTVTNADTRTGEDTINGKGIVAFSRGTAIYASSDFGYGIYAFSEGTAINAISLEQTAINASSDGIAIKASSDIGTSVFADIGISGKGLVVNSGVLSIGNVIEHNKNSTINFSVNQAGEVTAAKFIKQSGTAAQLLAANGSVITAGTNITISGGTISSSGGVTPQTGQIILTAGMTSFTTPATGTLDTVYVFELVGAGGGGAGSANSTGGAKGSAGGGGGYVYKRITGLSGGNTYASSVVIGTAGLGSALGVNASGGTATTLTILGVTYTANGGGGGLATGNAAGGAGGTATNGDINYKGQNGSDSVGLSTVVPGALGGSSHKGWGLGGSSVRTGIAGNNATGNGGGGGGGHASAGGNGSNGIIFVQWFN